MSSATLEQLEELLVGIEPADRAVFSGPAWTAELKRKLLVERSRHGTGRVRLGAY